MATSAEIGPSRDVSAGRVFERVFATVRHNPVPTVGLSLLIGALPSLLTTYLMEQLESEILAQPGFGIGFYVLMLLFIIIGMVIGALTQAVLTRSTVAESEGRKVSLGECLSAGFAVLLPLIGLSILLSIGVAFGFMLLIVPGIILYLMWSVAVPALIEEQRGIFGSFARSRELTDGAKWKIFGIMLVVMMVYWLLSAIPGVIVISGMDLFTAQAPFQSPSYIIISLIISTLINLFWGLVQASLYVELRDWKDGPATAQLEHIFR